MGLLLKEIRHNKLLWLLAFVPVLFLAARARPDSHTTLFVLSVLAIVPLAALLSGPELESMMDRARAVLAGGHFPHDPSGRRYPWPLV